MTRQSNYNLVSVIRLIRALLFPFIMECCAFAQQRYDLLLKCGHVIDAENGVSALPDVAIARDRIALCS